MFFLLLTNILISLGKTGPAKGPFAIELPREASTIEAQNALRRQLKIKDKKLVLKVKMTVALLFYETQIDN